jgi:hypothetical protein
MALTIRNVAWRFGLQERHYAVCGSFVYFAERAPEIRIFFIAVPLNQFTGNPQVAGVSRGLESKRHSRDHKRHHREGGIPEERDAMPDDPSRSLGNIIVRPIFDQEGVKDSPGVSTAGLAGWREFFAKALDNVKHNLQVF